MQRNRKTNVVRIANSVLHEAFPELSKVTFELKLIPLNDQDLMEFGIYTIHGFPIKDEFFIETAPCILNAPQEAIKAAYAHEFVHALQQIQKGVVSYLLHEQIYVHSSAYRKRVEAITDLEVTVRGFGEGLLLLEEFRVSTKRHNGFGLPCQHIKDILSAYGKLPNPLTYKDYVRMFGNGNHA